MADKNLDLMGNMLAPMLNPYSQLYNLVRFDMQGARENKEDISQTTNNQQPTTKDNFS
ncbi:MAG: hypothetical protein F6J86_17755 [Symploca sp. SIO1B1]|nr:hypothetical protein [Symploca sp. SIO1B1]